MYVTVLLECLCVHMLYYEDNNNGFDTIHYNSRSPDITVYVSTQACMGEPITSSEIKLKEISVDL